MWNPFRLFQLNNIFSSFQRRHTIHDKWSYSKKLMKLVENNSSTSLYSLTEEDINLITLKDDDLKRRFDLLIMQLTAKEAQRKTLPKFVTLKSFQRAIQFEQTEPFKYYYYFMKDYGEDKEDIASWMISRDEPNLQPPPPVAYLEHDRSSVVGILCKRGMTHYYNCAQIQGMQFGQNVVLDFSSVKWLSQKYRMDLSKEIRDVLLLNGKNRRPFHLHLCSYLENSSVPSLVKYLQKHLQTCPVSVTADSYLDRFSKKDIVYLTPYAEEEFEYNPNNVFVVSPLYDHKVHVPKYKNQCHIRKVGLPYGYDWFVKDNVHLPLTEIYKLLATSKNQ